MRNMAELSKIPGAAWHRNEEYGGLQVQFTDKPPEEVRKAMSMRGFKYSKRQNLWYATDRGDRRELLDSIAEHGSVIGEKISFAEKMDRKITRAENRAGRYLTKATRLQNAGRIKLERSNKIASYFPMGQPVLVGHHSEGRHRRTLERIHNIADINAAKQISEKAEAAARTLRSFQDVGVQRK